MAKLKARGREEIFRVQRVSPGRRDGVAEVHEFRAMTSDGSVLERLVLRYTPEEIAKNYGERSHDYGWKVRGRAKAGLSLEQLLKGYLDHGWSLADASSAYFRREGDVIEGLSQEPFITVEKAEKRREKILKSRDRAESSRAERARTNDGPGFYVTNNYVGEGAMSHPRIADHERPFKTCEAAVEFASRRLENFREFAFNYLLPVAVVESTSRQAAERNEGHVWWVDGVSRGPAIDPRQAKFEFGE